MADAAHVKKAESLPLDEAQGAARVPVNKSQKPKSESVEPDFDPESVLHEPAKADRTKPVKIFSQIAPKPLAAIIYNLQDATSSFRFHALKLMPSFIVNHSSNFIGLTQLVGEAFYFKSSGVNKFVKDEHRGTWKAWVYPPINVVEGVFKKSAFRINPKQLLNPKHMVEEVGRFFDLKAAGQADFLRDGKLSNRWSARSGFAGIVSMAIAAAFPDEKDDPEVTEKMAIMAAQTPMRYAAYRIGKGLAFPFTATLGLVKKALDPHKDHHIGDGKREFSGIGMALTGFFSVLAGFRQPRHKAGMWHYDFNKWQTLGGLITTYAGGALLMGIDNQQGWTNYGKYQFGRLAVLPMSIKERFPNKEGFSDPGAKYYLAAQGVFQFKNVVASTIGGAHIIEDDRNGRIILDQRKHRNASFRKAKEEKHHQKELAGHNNDESTAAAPAFAGVKVSSAEKAMPDRVVAQAEI